MFVHIENLKNMTDIDEDRDIHVDVLHAASRSIARKLTSLV